jgi:hypothetical protein
MHAFRIRLLAASVAVIVGALGGVPSLLGPPPGVSAATASPVPSVVPLLGTGPLDVGPVDPADLETEIGVENDAFMARLDELGIPATVDAYGPGTHSGPYWERALRDSLPMLPEALGEPTPAPSPVAMPVAGALEAGTYFIENPYRSCEAGCSMYRGVTVTLPDGWAVSDGLVSKHLGQPDEMAFSIWTVDGVYADACHWQDSALRPLDHVGYRQDASGGVVIVGGDENALVIQAGRIASAPTPGSQDGRYLMRIELAIPADLDLATCDGGELRSWTGVGGDVKAHHVPGQVDIVSMVDVDRRPLVIDASYLPATTEEDRAQLEAILASMLWGYG